MYLERLDFLYTNTCTVSVCIFKAMDTDTCHRRKWQDPWRRSVQQGSKCHFANSGFSILCDVVFTGKFYLVANKNPGKLQTNKSFDLFRDVFRRTWFSSAHVHVLYVCAYSKLRRLQVPFSQVWRTEKKRCGWKKRGRKERKKGINQWRRPLERRTRQETPFSPFWFFFRQLFFKPSLLLIHSFTLRKMCFKKRKFFLLKAKE